MASAPPCSSCGTNINDFSGTSQLLKIQRMISENYLMIFVCIVMLIIIGYMLYFTINQIVDCVRVYHKAINVQNVIGVSFKSNNIQDNEVYESETPYNAFDPINHFEPGKAEFMSNLEKRYDDYNTAKSKYILSTYERTNDDIVDQKTLYKEHDDYDYQVKD